VSPGQRFGRRLREQREHRGISLDHIANTTKIKASCLAGLERGDVSGWPAGIFQRSFVREYARAIGLDPEAVVAEFAQIFSADEAGRQLDRADSRGAELRLTLAIEPDPSARRIAPALVAGLLEAGGLVVLALIASWMTSIGFGTASSALLLLYYPIATSVIGCTPASWLVRQEGIVPDRRAAIRSMPAADIRDRLYLVKSTTDPEQPEPITDEVALESDSPRRQSAAR
jgi:transcriptional regulator with XRE-family HTH domain